ncbi:hypothetical protein BMJ32_19635 [Sinorhizobium medicae]|uniref:Uncharacterized protein n=1 Tax=Sinorhizobium medicae TaxID=110321 RepID=A0ABX4TF36_9HYPH|nr:hypothetical protein BMJ35_01715 [Sinorhizobium medicae]PLT95052.1 hypothetical protein BMJ33_29490 [Sinorhizobium medicae]PLU00020.1 hypothetical protein BMJ32_19635 [Sinorhizobium medicae]PLU02038.1 hypothetical protein BMJ34_11370 [Sinorhizobium medicae]PLU12640.1 hypothetical protein BMJ29_31080 [Sinorhizobium medicae]
MNMAFFSRDVSSLQRMRAPIEAASDAPEQEEPGQPPRFLGSMGITVKIRPFLVHAASIRGSRCAISTGPTTATDQPTCSVIHSRKARLIGFSSLPSGMAR